MTIDEAIKYWEKLRKTFMEHYEKEESYWGKSHWMTSVQAIDAALSALREKAERDNPQPLTVDTLYFMDGHPVWWWNKSHAPACTLCVKNKYDANNPFFVCYDDPFADDDCTGLVKYQKLIKWGYRPYRYPPKEAH